MARLAPPRGYEGEENLPRTWRNLQNCFNNGKNNVIGRPGIQALNTTGKVARGAFTWNGSQYQVVSTDLIKITDKTTGAFSVIGTIEGSEPVETDFGFTHTVIVVRGGKIYSLDKTDTLVDISGQPNFEPCVDVTHINGRFVYIPADGDPAFFSDVGAPGTVQADSFFDAEELPDENKATINIRNTLLIMGDNSTEQFRDAGGFPVPFARIPGGRFDIGYIGGLLEYAGGIMFIGRERNQDRGIYFIGNGRAEKISNARIDLLLAKYTLSEMAEAISNRFVWRGYDLATFRLNRDSFGFFGGNWFLLDTIFDGESRPWGGGYITHFEGEYFTAFEDRIGKLAKINTDYGERITRIIDVGFEQEDNRRFSLQSAGLGISQGYNSANGSVAIQMSRDGVIFGAPVYRNLGSIGQYSNRLEWNYPGGLGNYDGFAALRFLTTEDIDFAADHIVVEVAQ